MNLRTMQQDAQLMMDVGNFINVIADLINDNATEEDTQGTPFLNGYRIGGLMVGLKLAGDSLSGRGEDLSDFVFQEEEKAQAALQRRKGQDKSLESNVGGKSGTSRAA